MHILEKMIVKVSYGLDSLAGLILAATALLVVANILGRTLLQRSILGTYEMVGFLTAAVVGLALARCAVENSHIAIDFILDRLPARLQCLVDLVLGIPVFLFLLLATYNLFIYGARIAQSGEVSPTTKLIFYPFIYLVALGFLALALTVMLKLLQSALGGEQK
jgi:TRAP-type C4-dicarboxylate transport system permease small subunit